MTALYIAIGVVVYYYCGSYVASPALGSAGALMKKVCYGLALPGLLASVVLVTHVSLRPPSLPTQHTNHLRRSPPNTSSSAPFAAQSTSTTTPPSTGSPGSVSPAPSPSPHTSSPPQSPSLAASSVSSAPCSVRSCASSPWAACGCTITGAAVTVTGSGRGWLRGRFLSSCPERFCWWVARTGPLWGLLIVTTRMAGRRRGLVLITRTLPSYVG